MIKKDQLVEVKWHNKNREHFESLGYIFTQNGDSIYVHPDELTNGSKSVVFVVCDYCGKEYTKRYKDYLKGLKTGKCCCISCQSKKLAEILEDKYGVYNVFQLDDVKGKIRDTNLSKHGAENIAHAPKIAEKIKQTNLERYGVPYTTQVPDVVAKMRESLYKNGSVPSSKAEIAMCELLHEMYGDNNCKDNYAVDRLNMDCLVDVDGIFIDFEYDGLYWHKDREDYDRRRNYYLIDRGYRIVRIKANKKDELPSKQQIKDAVDYLVKGNHHLTYIDMNI